MKYLECVEELFKEFSRDANGEELNSYLFEILRTNFSRLIGLTSTEEAVALAREVLLCQRWVGIDQRFLDDLYEYVVVYGEGHVRKSLPAIYVTFHTGSYRFVNYYLNTLGIPFTLIVDKYVMEQQGDTYYDMLDKGNLKHRTDAAFEVMDANDSKCVLKCIKSLQQGRSLLFYIDGNSGTGGMDVNSNMLELQFLNDYIYARKGVAYISHLSRMPIVPVISERVNREKHTLCFGDPIYPDRVGSREEFTKNVTTFLFNLLADFIKRNPSQWEGWLYYQKFIVPRAPKTTNSKPLSDDDRLVFNHTDFGYFQIGQESYLLDRAQYAIKQMDQQETDLINEFREPRTIASDQMQHPIINDWLNSSVFIKSKS